MTNSTPSNISWRVRAAISLLLAALAIAAGAHISANAPSAEPQILAQHLRT